MTLDLRQPWTKVRLFGVEAELQIMDPRSAFTVEPILLDLLGEDLAQVAGAPDSIMKALVPARGGDAIDFAGEGLRALADLLAYVLERIPTDSSQARDLLSIMVMGRVRVAGEIIDSERRWAEVFHPFAKWWALVAQLRNTFGPLWGRKPYGLQSSAKDYGVPEPQGVDAAMGWAVALSKTHAASSPAEVLTTWTPVMVIEAIELAAQEAEINRRASE